MQIEQPEKEVPCSVCAKTSVPANYISDDKSTLQPICFSCAAERKIAVAPRNKDGENCDWI